MTLNGAIDAAVSAAVSAAAPQLYYDAERQVTIIVIIWPFCILFVLLFTFFNGWQEDCHCIVSLYLKCWVCCIEVCWNCVENISLFPHIIFSLWLICAMDTNLDTFYYCGQVWKYVICPDGQINFVLLLYRLSIIFLCNTLLCGFSRIQFFINGPVWRWH